MESNASMHRVGIVLGIVLRDGDLKVPVPINLAKRHSDLVNNTDISAPTSRELADRIPNIAAPNLPVGVPLAPERTRKARLLEVSRSLKRARRSITSFRLALGKRRMFENHAVPILLASASAHAEEDAQAF
jgi:hypothetical protein